MMTCTVPGCRRQWNPRGTKDAPDPQGRCWFCAHGQKPMLSTRDGRTVAKEKKRENP